MTLIFHILFITMLFAAEAAKEVRIEGDRKLEPKTIRKMTGLEQDPSLSTTEVKQRLQNSNLFNEVRTTRDDNVMNIRVSEKGTWFVVPYFSSDPNSKIFGIAGGISSLFGDNASAIARLQTGTANREATLLVRDEFFLGSLWILGVSLDYEDALHRIFRDREIVHRTENEYHGGSFQTGYHLTPHLTLGFNSYIEQHRFEQPAGPYDKGLQVSHRLLVDWTDFYLEEGLARGAGMRAYFEQSNPGSDFQFRKYGLSSQASVYRAGNFNWIARPRFEAATPIPRYQLFELGAGRLRSFPMQIFRDSSYVAFQNDVLLTSFDVWKIKLRPLVYADWAFVEKSGRTGVGGGFQVFFSEVTVPALQFFGGYGFNPRGFTISAAIGPQI